MSLPHPPPTSNPNNNPKVTQILRVMYGKNYLQKDKTQCEKFAKSEEAMGRLNSGEKFDAVAREMSEDKANRGRFMLSSEFRTGRGHAHSFTKEGHLAGRPRGIWIPSLRRWRLSSRPARSTNPRFRGSRPGSGITSSWSRGASSKVVGLGRATGMPVVRLVFILSRRVSHAVCKG